jgi:hypothetical protein
VTNWHARKALGDQHEQDVIRALQHRGWTVQPCGQGTYPTAIQQALRLSDSALRQFPDMIAARGTEVVAIDAKTRMPSTTTDQYAISRKCLLAGLQFLGMNAPVPLYYVFGDLRVLTPAEVMHHSSDAARHPSGSYHWVSTRRAHPFDTVFGDAAAAKSA